MDLTQSVLALVALLAPFAAAGAISASAVAGKRRVDIPIAQIGAAVTFCASAIALVRLAAGWSAGTTWMPLGTWFAIGAQNPLRIDFGLQLDITAAVLAAVLSLTLLCVLAWRGAGSSNAPAPSVGRIEIGASALLFASIGMAMSTGLAELFVFWQVATAAAYMIYSATCDTPHESALMKKFMLVQRVGDVFLLCALFAVAAGFQTLDFAALFRNAANWAQAAPQRGALIDFIGLCLVGACLARCGLFPLLGWTDELSTGSAINAVLILSIGVVPAGAILLIRCLPLLEASVASAALGAFLGGLSAFAAAVCAAVAQDQRKIAGWCCVSVLGTLVFGLFFATSAAGTWGLVLLAAYIPASAAILGAFSTSAEQTMGGGASPRQGSEVAGFPRAAVAVCMAVLLCGLCGQAGLTAAAVRWLLAGPIAGTASLWIASLLLACAQFLIAFAMAKALVERRGSVGRAAGGSPTIIETSLVGAEPATAKAPSRWPISALAGCVVAVALASVVVPLFGLAARTRAGSRIFDPADLPVFVLDVAISVAGLFVGWRPQAAASAKVSRLLAGSSLSGLGRNRFYCDTVLFLLLVLPVRGVAQLARFIDWFVIDAVVTGVPTGLIDSAADLLEEIQRRSVAFYVSSAVLGTGVLAGVIVWLRS